MSERIQTGDALVGAVLDDSYRVESLLGEGGMGAVYRLTQLRLDKPVAIKVMTRELASNQEDVERFRREARSTSPLGHPNIVQVFDSSITPSGDPFLVMEFLEGEDLEHRLRRVARLSLQEKDGVPAVERVEVKQGADITVALKVGPRSTPGTAAPVVEVATPGSSPETSHGWWLGRKWTWVTAGSTILLAGAAAGIGLSVNSRYDELKSNCGSGSTSWPGCNHNEVNSLRTRKNIANVFWGLAGAAAVTTGVLFFVEGHPMTVTPVAGETTGVVARTEF